MEARLTSARDFLDKEEGIERVVIAQDAVKLAATTVRRIMGDARTVLDIF